MEGGGGVREQWWGDLILFRAMADCVFVFRPEATALAAAASAFIATAATLMRTCELCPQEEEEACRHLFNQAQRPQDL